MSKVLITGGLGNLGSWLTRHFTQLNYEVYVLAKNKREILDKQNFTYISCDIASLEDCKDKLSNIAFEYDFISSTFRTRNVSFDKNYLIKTCKSAN